ncbi:PREDICTED: putative cyclic nucleotide-gated ion channel 18 [Brassica oleracea var. oleracea]|uniref:putative cyclic nucleotide-gated ion channel 18 n=1 Tax=Brassica oleracea var. oleracea TaxID=109376 RepID=UPI0006A6C277|nr:PREDICTED: putative cyclic nucleotide-gated ion channel 18 [Brassica oleracea var. oleracea]
MNKIRSLRFLLPETITSAASNRGSVAVRYGSQVLPWRHQILDPDSSIVTYWNHVFLVTSILALFLDPFYFYAPYVGGPACLSVDVGLAATVTFFRSVADLFHLLHIFMKFRTAFVARSSRVFGRGELVRDPREIAMKYLKSDFIVDVAAMLPLPQLVIWLVIPAATNGTANHANSTLALIVLVQYIPRSFIIFPLNQRIIKTTGFIAKTAWAGAAYNLLLYILASHVLGAMWYLSSIGRQFSCWSKVCEKDHALRVLDCLPSFLDCKSLQQPERQYWQNVTQVLSHCDATSSTTNFKFGMFAEAFTTQVATTDFVSKYLYCLWWGLRNLSSYGQNITTSVYLGETLFCITICIFGLILFTLLIGNMQTSLQSMSVRVEEWRVKRRDTEEWMRHRQLPPELQERVRRFVQYKWLATRGVDEESILQSLPTDLRREIQRHLCLALVRRVPFFSQMDDQLLDAICGCLVSSLSTAGTYIFREGDPVDEMLFVIRGQIESSTTNGGRSGFFNSTTLRPGDFCGEELLTWALMPNSTLNFPSSTRSVRALSEVEAFALSAEDLKFVAHQFKRLQSKKLQHAFRYYSHQWRAWGACFVQSAWRRYKRRKLAKELSLHESSGYYYRDETGYNEEGDEENYYGSDDDDFEGERLSVDNTNNSQNLGATMLASKFAANTRRGTNQKASSSSSTGKKDGSSNSLKMPQLFKPDEPDFSMDKEDV